MASHDDFTLDAKYRLEEGTIFLSGIQALVRLPLDQHRADTRRRVRTATLISGYRGSPLGGLDLTLERNPKLLAEHDVVFISGLNEDLGATAIYGAQLANMFPRPKYDGVLGMWYGKGPGVDRTGDIFKHANYAGIGRWGGVLALAGDDPLSKSSTLPTHSEVAFYDAFFPTLFPGTVQEILDLGRYGFEMSRYSGLWVGFKIVTNVADEIGTAVVHRERLTIRDPGFTWEGKPWRATQNPMLLPPFGLDLEREIHYGRLEAAKAFAAAHPINRITVPTPEAWLGVAAAGKTYGDLREALRELGLDDEALRRYGIRLLQVGLLWPMEAMIVREFARGLEELFVVEEKRSFVETFIRDVLYNQSDRPRIVGKQDEQGRPLVPANGELDADRIALLLASRLEKKRSCQTPGDGAFFPSGSLAVRQAVAAGTNVTFKILYNSAVAMTGGQDAAGAMPVPDLTRLLEAEGVKRIIVTTDEPDKYDAGSRWGRGTEVWHRDRLDEAQRVLRDIPGVTVLVHDQRCAAEKRRLRKRGRLENPALRVFINESVCEGCGDCGVKSNCLSVQPVDTEFGRKTQIHQSSCNKDYSCLRGDCPSFLTVIPKGEPRAKQRKVFQAERDLPEPALRVPATANVFMTGIGGTGVVTVNQILGTAALLDGKHVRGLDQTGLSQKGGPVVSHLKISERPVEVSNKVAAGEADCYLGFDILVATSPQNLDHASGERTIAVVSTSQVPTGAMVTKTDVQFPEASGLHASIDRFTRKDENVYLDALGLAERLFDDHMAANLIVLGAAYQAGAIPVAAQAIERAIALNGVSVEMNTQAFRAGRLAVVNPELVAARKVRRVGAAEVEPALHLHPEARALVDSAGGGGGPRPPPPAPGARPVEDPDAPSPRPHLEVVTRARHAERAATPGTTALGEAVARHLFKLMAYKDEYEVARLHLQNDLAAALKEQYPDGVTIHYNLHPPMLRALGWQRKIKLGRWFEGVFRALRAMRRLRGSGLHPFGRAEERRVERALVGEYKALVDQALVGVDAASHALAVKLANLPDLIRGYEEIKLANVRRFRAEVRALGF